MYCFLPLLSIFSWSKGYHFRGYCSQGDDCSLLSIHSSVCQELFKALGTYHWAKQRSLPYILSVKRDRKQVKIHKIGEIPRMLELLMCYFKKGKVVEDNRDLEHRVWVVIEEESRLQHKMDLINKVTWSKYLKEVRELVMQTSGRRAFQAAGK